MARDGRAQSENGAFLLRSARGGNFMLQSSGIPSKIVQDAVSEVADDFNAYSRKRKTKGLLDPTSSLSAAASTRQREDDSSAYNVSLGQRHVLQSKYLVTFRMVDTIMVFYVCDPDANPLISLRYVDAAAKILVGLSKGVDISHKRLAKKYADLYVLLGKLLARGVRHLPSAFVHAPATNEKLLTLPVSTFEASRKLKKVLDKKKTKNAFVRTTSRDSGDGEEGEGQVAGTAAGGVPKLAVDEELMRRVWDKSGHDVRLVEFTVPAEALPPPPKRVIGAKRTPPAPPMLSETLAERAFSGALSESGDTGSDDEIGSDKHGGDTEDGVVAAAADTSALEDAAAVPDGATLDQEQRRIRRRDLQQAIVMAEVWKGVARGDRLSSVAVHGEIKRALAPYNIDRVLFRVHPSGTLAVDACLMVASMHKKHVKVVSTTGKTGSRTETQGVFSATLSGIPIDATYLKYALPSAAVRPPLQASLQITPRYASSVNKGTKGNSIADIAVHIPYAVDPESPGLVDVSVTLCFPPDVDSLLKTSHKAEWCPVQSKVRWTVAELKPGTQGVICAVVSCRGNGASDVLERISSQTKAKILFSGYPGRSYSGLRFDMGDDLADRADDGGGSAEFFSGNVRTFGELTLTV